MQPENSQESQLHQYTLAKQQIEELLRAAMQFFEGIKEEACVEQANWLDELSEVMHSYMLKREALRRGLLNDNEKKAWLRALLLLAGERTAHALT